MVCAALSWGIAIFAAFSSLPAFFEIVLLLASGVVVFYALYLVKVRLGIDIFPNWGLHLRGPRTLTRRLVARAKRLVLSAPR